MRRIAIALILAAGLAGCGHSGGGGSSTTGSTAPTARETSAPATLPASAASRELAGAVVRVMGLWSGPELESFLAVAAAWEAATGGVVDWDGTNDLPAALDDAIAAGRPPDVAVLSNLASMQALARDGRLVPLDDVLDRAQLETDYAAPWLALGRVDERLYGIFYKVSDKSTVWYRPPAFAAAGYEVPGTWDELLALADTMVADGHVPFSIVAASGPASGWALTDWISELVLNGCGPERYDDWIAGEVAWTDPCIEAAFERFATLLRTKGYVLGGSERILATGDAEGADPLYADPPEAYLYYLASFAQAFIAARYPDLEAGDDYAFFRFPTVEPAHAGAVTIGADVPVLVTDTPAARSFMAYLAGAEAQEAWIARGGFTSVNRSVSPDAYLDPVARAVADDLTSAKVVRFSAGDMLPFALQRAWWGAMLDLAEDPAAVDEVLASLDRAAQRAR